MGRTSIPCADETRDVLTEMKKDGETWDDCLTRLADGTPPSVSDDEPDEVLEKLDRLESMIASLDDSVGTDGTTEEVPVNEIREAVRIEVRDQIQELLR